jgi:hypothetical protein
MIFRPVFLLFFVLLTGCTTTTFKQVEMRDDAVIDGKGGAKIVVDGMEIWEHGEPPRKFRVIGLIEDERPQAIVPMMRMKSEIVKKAKDSGGQAVVEIRNQSQITGYAINTFANVYGGKTGVTGSATSVASPLSNNRALYAVIRYVNP